MRPLVAGYLGLTASDEDDEEAPELPKGGFGAFSVDYMNQSGQMLMYHHCFPDEGGFNDQDAEWTEAFFNWMRYWHYLQWELQPEVEIQRMQRMNRKRDGQDPLAHWFGREANGVGDLL